MFHSNLSNVSDELLHCQYISKDEKFLVLLTLISLPTAY